MKSLTVLAGALLALLPALAGAAPTALPSFSTAEIDSGRAIQQLSRIAYDNAMARVAKATTGCTKDKVKVRKEWLVSKSPHMTAMCIETCV